MRDADVASWLHLRQVEQACGKGQHTPGHRIGTRMPIALRPRAKLRGPSLVKYERRALSTIPSIPAMLQASEAAVYACPFATASRTPGATSRAKRSICSLEGTSGQKMKASKRVASASDVSTSIQ